MPTLLDDLSYEPVSKHTTNVIDSMSSGSDDDDDALVMGRPGQQNFYQPDYKRIEKNK